MGEHYLELEAQKIPINLWHIFEKAGCEYSRVDVSPQIHKENSVLAFLKENHDEALIRDQNSCCEMTPDVLKLMIFWPGLCYAMVSCIRKAETLECLLNLKFNDLHDPKLFRKSQFTGW